MQRARDCSITRGREIPSSLAEESVQHLDDPCTSSQRWKQEVIELRSRILGMETTSTALGSSAHTHTHKIIPRRRSSGLLREEGTLMKDEVLSLHLERPFCAAFGNSLICPGMLVGPGESGWGEREREIAGRRQGQGIC